ncbi:MAG: phosphoadenylyl-sulfate reductase [Balneolaceae bacterium]|nr:phosphoadenylyl-sulfate reductase [Balneolaceae bacterium]
MSTPKVDDLILQSDIIEIEKQVINFQNNGNSLFLTSSFQTHSIPLLHLIHSIDQKIPIYFLDTGYHFTETISFKNELKTKFGFNIIDVSSPIERINQRDSDGRLMYASDPDYCCYMNKVLPLEPLLQKHDIWVSGVRKSQSSFRAGLEKIIKGKFDTLRYHPILDWTSKMIYDYRLEFNLPAHPLEEKGYFSVGCMPCTRKQDVNSDPREARWFGMNKTECGLQTETVESK